MDFFNTSAAAVQFCVYEPGDLVRVLSLHPGGLGRASLAAGASFRWNAGARTEVQVVFWINGNAVGPRRVQTSAVTVDAAGNVLNAPPHPPTAKDSIRHIVVLMLENRSFDNVLGWLYADTNNQPPRNIPPRPQPSFDGLTENGSWNTLVAAAHDAPGAQRLFARKGVTSSPWWQQPNPNPKEEYPSFLEQMFGTQTPGGGAAANMQGFVASYAKVDPANPGRIMECHTPSQLPVLNQLARSYAVCDRWFGSIPSETWPNRSFLHAGTSFGRLNNGDQLFEDRDPVPNLTFYGGRKTIFDVLDAHGVPWKVYHDSLLGPSLVSTQFWTLPQKLTRAAVSMGQFEADARNGTLPAYAFIEPEFMLGANDQHPGPGCDMRRGEALIRRVWTALRQGPRWNNTLLVITYDEHGGCYDHVPPPATAVPPDLSTPQFNIPGFAPFRQYGPRVPLVLVSPWIEPGTVFRAAPGQGEYDHTSILATLRDWLFPSVPADWLPSARVAAAPTLWPVLTRSTPRTDTPVLQVPTDDGHGAYSLAGRDVGTVVRSTDKLDIFMVDEGGVVRSAAWEPAFADGWHGWWGIGTTRFPAGAPVTAVSRSRDKLDIFATDLAGVVRSAAWEPGFADGWHGWWDIAGGRAVPGAAVTAVSRAPDKLDIFVVGLDGRAMTAAWDAAVPGGWRGWRPILDARLPAGAPIHVVSRSRDKLDIFATDSAGVVRSAAWEPGFADGWHGWWEIAGGRAAPGAAVTAVSRAPDKLDIFVVGTDGRVWTAAWDAAVPGGWHGWWAIGNVLFPQGAVIHAVSRSPNKLDIFGTDVAGVVRTAAWEPGFADGWHGWWELAGGRAQPGAPVSAAVRNVDTMDVFVLGADGRTSTAAWAARQAGGWRGWSSIR